MVGRGGGEGISSWGEMSESSAENLRAEQVAEILWERRGMSGVPGKKAFDLWLLAWRLVLRSIHCR